MDNKSEEREEKANDYEEHKKPNPKNKAYREADDHYCDQQDKQGWVWILSHVRTRYK